VGGTWPGAERELGTKRGIGRGRWRGAGSGTQDTGLGGGQHTYLFGRRAAIAIGWQTGRKGLAGLYSRKNSRTKARRAASEGRGRQLRPAKIWI